MQNEDFANIAHYMGVWKLTADGQPFETRNRVTLCNCGSSSQKPLCDGTHREMAEELGRRRPAKTR